MSDPHSVVDLDQLRTDLDIQVRRKTAWRQGKTPEEALAWSEEFRRLLGSGDRRMTIKNALWWLRHAHLPRTPPMPKSTQQGQHQQGESR